MTITEDKVEQIAQHIVAALEYSQGSHSLEDVINGIESGEFQLWPGETSTVVTQIIKFPQKKVLHVFLAGGNQEELKEMDPYVVQWAKEQGCSAITFTGRVGWARSQMRELGFELTHVMMSKEI